MLKAVGGQGIIKMDGMKERLRMHVCREGIEKIDNSMHKQCN